MMMRLILPMLLCGVCVTVLAVPPKHIAPQSGELQDLLNTSSKGLSSLLRSEIKPAPIEETKEAARKAVMLIEMGQNLGQEQPLSRQRKEELLGWLHFTLGLISVHKKEHGDAVQHLHRAIQFESWVQRDPRVYRALGQAYEEGEYRKLVEPFRNDYGGLETIERKARMKPVERMIDLIIDAYSRAVALCGAESRWQQERQKSGAKLRRFYEYRKGSMAGLNEFISNSLSQPLPAP